MEIGTIWEGRMTKIVNVKRASLYVYVGGWRDGKKNKWGLEIFPRNVKCCFCPRVGNLKKTSEIINFYTTCSIDYEGKLVIIKE